MCDNSLVTRCARVWSSHKCGSDASCSSFSMRLRRPSTSSTRSTVVRVQSKAAMSA
ncbi:Uncharacterised protein [Mycobacterium tuberculosis]|uniref:Uncharacterized protein n=1 Tax=Mycobacterium tuberculosis TaxID=1773 RepID=A0A916LEC0_MYCTX|nr:Uncharacterised protein [Mycobacterium tuberculosis]COY76206.1 Uncharacterised protein [Mycobacterium tuberculosis]